MANKPKVRRNWSHSRAPPSELTAFGWSDQGSLSSRSQQPTIVYKRLMTYIYTYIWVTGASSVFDESIYMLMTCQHVEPGRRGKHDVCLGTHPDKLCHTTDHEGIIGPFLTNFPIPYP